MSEKGIFEKAVDIPPRTNWIGDWLRWCPTSAELLEQAETKMFSYLRNPPETSFVPITLDKDDGEYRIRTCVSNKEAEGKATPLVLLHGFASGIGLWVLNIESLSQNRPLYALDILGFGLSSRPIFNRDAEAAENQFVDSIEAWRKKVGLKKFILLGHSMGGFLAAAYSIKYPERIQHLILADPWGFPVPDLSTRKVELPVWVKAIAAMLRPFNPLAGLRAAGPWGPGLVKRLRPDILQKFENVVADPSDVGNYIYHCNAQHPSGESAFKSMSAPFGWANRPMIERVSQLKQDIPISFVYGARSWIDSSSGYKIRDQRENSFVEVKLIQGAGHHVYADKAEEFNEVVSEICKKVDLGGISTSRGKSTDISNDALTVDDCEEKTILEKSV